MPLGPRHPSKPEDPYLDPTGLGIRKNEEMPDGPGIFNNQMGHMGQSVFGVRLVTVTGINVYIKIQLEAIYSGRSDACLL